MLKTLPKRSESHRQIEAILFVSLLRPADLPPFRWAVDPPFSHRNYRNTHMLVIFLGGSLPPLKAASPIAGTFLLELYINHYIFTGNLPKICL